MEKKKIIVADDEADLLALIKMNLESTGEFEAILVNDPLKVESVCQQEHADLLLSDFLMPGRDGADIVWALRQDPETEALPVIFMSGLGEGFSERLKAIAKTDPEKAAMAEKVQGLIEKPFVFDELLTKIRAALAG